MGRPPAGEARIERGHKPRALRGTPARIIARGSTEHAEACAKRIARLYAQEGKLARELARIRHERDRELVRASAERVPGVVIGHATLVATGRPQTDEELRRVETRLRKAVHKAKLRLRVAAGNKSGVAAGAHARETAPMRNSNTPYRRRVEVTEEWYGQPPPEDLGEPGPSHAALVGGDDLGDPDDDDDGDLGDAEQDDDIDDDDDGDQP